MSVAILPAAICPVQLIMKHILYGYMFFDVFGSNADETVVVEFPKVSPFKPQATRTTDA